MKTRHFNKLLVKIKLVNVFDHIIHYFYTFFNKVEGGHILGLKCDSLNSVVEDDGKDNRLYIKNESTPIKGSDVIIQNGVYEIIAG